MTDISNQGTDQPQEVDDFDVEGHILKEVAVAATLLAGGAGATSLALDNPLPGTTSGAQSVVAGVHSDVDDRVTWAQGVAAGPLATAAGAVADAQAAVDDAASVAVTTATPVVGSVTDTVTRTTELAGEVVADPIGTSDRVVDESVQTVRETRDKALVTAKDAAGTAVTTATGAIGAAVDTAGGAVGTTTTVATSTAQSAYDLVDPTVEIGNEEGKTSASVGAAGKTVRVEVG